MTFSLFDAAIDGSLQNMGGPGAFPSQLDTGLAANNIALIDNNMDVAMASGPASYGVAHKTLKPFV